MSEYLGIDASIFKKVLTNLGNLFPKGSISMPVGIHISKGNMDVVCAQGCVYQATVPIDDYDAVYDVTILYHDVTPLLNGRNELQMKFTVNSVVLKGQDFEVEFPFGYSDVPTRDFKNLNFKAINSYTYLDSFQKVINMSLDKLYGKISPIHILNDVALQKYGNTWVQVRTTGLPLDATMDIEHVKFILKFVPTDVCVSIQNTVVFRNRYAVVQLPCKRNMDKTLITELMQDMSAPVTLNIKSYSERVKNISKLDLKQHCKITVFEAGIKTSINFNNTVASVSAGNIEGAVVKVFELPIQLWLAFLKGLSDDTIQILTGGNKICLRTQSVIIVTHALL